MLLTAVGRGGAMERGMKMVLMAIAERAHITSLKVHERGGGRRVLDGRICVPKWLSLSLSLVLILTLSSFFPLSFLLSPSLSLSLIPSLSFSLSLSQWMLLALRSSSDQVRAAALLSLQRTPLFHSPWGDDQGLGRGSSCVCVCVIVRVCERNMEK